MMTATFIKYNPFVEGCNLHKGCLLAFCLFALIIVLMRLAM